MLVLVSVNGIKGIFCIQKEVQEVFVSWGNQRITEIRPPFAKMTVKEAFSKKKKLAQSAGAVEYTDCTSAEG